MAAKAAPRSARRGLHPKFGPEDAGGDTNPCRPRAAERGWRGPGLAPATGEIGVRVPRHGAGTGPVPCSAPVPPQPPVRAAHGSALPWRPPAPCSSLMCPVYVFSLQRIFLPEVLGGSRDALPPPRIARSVEPGLRGDPAGSSPFCPVQEQQEVGPALRTPQILPPAPE